MENFKTNLITTKKIHIKFLAIVLGWTLCLIMIPIHSALATTHTTGFFAGKYGKSQIYDVKRVPPYPTAGNPFTLSLFNPEIYDATANDNSYVDWGVNRYVQFAYDETQPSNPQVILNLYEADGTFVKNISNSGTVWGLDPKGFLYVGAYGYGYFITNNNYNYSDVLTYTPNAGLVTNVTDLDNYTDATLSNLSISSGTLGPTFAGGTTSYTANVGNSVNSIKVTPTVNASHATVTVNGTTVESASASGDISLNVGDNTITVEVTAQDASTKKTYTVIVTRADAVSTDATLSNLSISSGTLNPTFAGGTTSYAASVGNSVNNIKVTPTVNESHSTVTVNGSPVASGAASGDISLNVGDNTITVEVTAQDASTKKTYTIVVTRADTVSTDATLSNLSISSGTLSPTFSSATTSYTANVGNSVNSIKITPTTNESHATVTVNGTTAASGAASGDISLNVGANTITVTVTAQDSSTKTYTVIVTRAADTVSTDATLSNLSISSGTLSPTFSSATTSYTANVGNSVNSIKITPTTNESHATVTVNGTTVESATASGDISLNVGYNTITVEVTAQDASTKTYTVIVTRADAVTSANAVIYVYPLNDITVVNGTAKSDLNLPGTVNVRLYNSSTTSAAVTWDNGNPNYDKNTAGTYTFTGTLTLPDVVTNISNLKARVNVIVQAINSSSSSNHHTSSSSGHHNSKSSSPKQINVNITDGGSDNVLSNTLLEKITDSNGTTKDTVTYTNQKAKETIAKLVNYGKDVTRIVATDTDTSVSETQVNIPKNTLATLSSGNINLEIETGGAIVSVPKESIQDLYRNGQLNGDLYFRLVPINDESKKEEIKRIASQEAVIKAVSGNSEIQVLGTPMTIDTNMSQRSVDIILPLTNITLPTDAAERDAFLKDLGVFIEHNDGENVLKRGEIVEYAPGVLGIKFTINKFGNFTIIKLNQQITSNIKPGWKQINGYWHFVKNDGSMVTGWYNARTGDWTYDGKDTVGQWFHLDSDGRMNTGWFKDTDGLWYFLCDGTDYGALGTMETGWKFINGTWYYFNSNGSMASNTTIDGYTLDTSGALV